MMRKMKHQQTLYEYVRIIVVSIILQVVLRLLETFLIAVNFGIQESLISSELFGIIYDLIITSAIFIAGYPIFFLFYIVSVKLANRIFISMLCLLTIIQFLILKYFLYQLVPLDSFLYQYSLKEILFTIATSNTNFIKVFLLLFLLLGVIFLIIRLLKRITFSKRFVSSIYVFCLVSLPTFIFINIVQIDFNKFSENKSLFFVSRSISYFLKSEYKLKKYSTVDALNFQNLYPSKTFKNQEYPLLHEFKDSHQFGSLFNRFDAAPNIVVLIVEGLNDDFIHQYKGGVCLMPFLSSLQSNSLYWNRCFTLGERSFAVVPSIMGSLPYGEIGFTLLNKLPRYLSLASILKANDYYTSFFYGQGSWFHRKDRFFQFNNIDLIVDDHKFSSKYKKIIVGSDNFFWGYNDKDLFNQSLEVIDTLPKKARFDIYFTGTSHSPFAITDTAYYDKKFLKIIGSINDQADLKFFNVYKKYIQSILFVDDALSDYFNKYKKRPEFENTVFIITGDHPMTEMPRTNSLKKYHVPLIIYSPKLKNTKIITQTVSHLDIYESMLSLLSEYKVKVPEISSALGSMLKIDNSDADAKIAFMNDNREIIDYYSNNYFLSGEKLYSVGKNLSLTISDDINALKKLQNELGIFKKTNYYISINDRILPDSLFCKYLLFNLIYSKENTSVSINTKSEFYSLVNSTKIKNRSFWFDISFTYLGKLDEQLSLVYQLSANKDSVIFWRSSGLKGESQSFQAHIKVPKQTTADSTVFFNSYFWNKSKQNVNLSNLKILIYQE